MQEYFDALLKERGYNVKTMETLSTGYYNTPSDLQVASYGPKTIAMVKENDVMGLREAMKVAGLSSNPCNQYGESLLHKACRRGYTELLITMIDAGAALQISDDHGRTPLHDACWAAQPAFAIVQLLIQCDRYLWFLRDCRGSLPLSYVHKSDWSEWKYWLDQHIDLFFPHQHLFQQNPVMTPTDLALQPPNSVPLSEQYTQKIEPLSLELVQMVARGTLSPREARVMEEILQRGDDEVTVADTFAASSISSNVHGLDEYEEDEDITDFSDDFDVNDDDYSDLVAMMGQMGH